MKLKNKLYPHPVGAALGFTIAVLYAFCALLFYFWPQQTLSIFKGWFHGLNLTQKIGYPFNIYVFIKGLIGIFLFSYLAGLIYGWTYNKCLSHCKKMRWIK